MNDKKCCICGGEFASHYKEKPYCNLHYLRMYSHGTPEKLERKRTNTYELTNDTVIITTAKGEKIFASKKDFDKLSKYSWCISKTGYAVANINYKVVKMHRYILGLTNPKHVVDHINGNTLDNRRNNLRICNNTENARNCGLSKNNNSGFAGVQLIKKTGRYRARITVNRKEIYLGHFKTLAEAVEARKKAEEMYFGEFARK